MFNLENTESNTTRSAGLIIEELQFDSGIAPFDLMLEISKKRDSLCCHFAYDTDLFDAATVRRLCGSYLTLLEGIVADHRRRISRNSVITADERHRLLVEWNETELEYPCDNSIHQLFEVQVARTPDSVAVVCGRSELTYRELNRQANQLARYLRGRCVGPETVVGLCLTPSRTW